MTNTLSEPDIRAVLARYLDELQRHTTAEDMLATVVTADFETGFEGGHMWTGKAGLEDFLRQREGFFDERHEVKDLLGVTTLSASRWSWAASSRAEDARHSLRRS